jgi:hypothetical protein
MALAERRPQLRPMSQERRRFQRVSVNLTGRYMLADRREFPCVVKGANRQKSGINKEFLDYIASHFLRLGSAWEASRGCRSGFGSSSRSISRRISSHRLGRA